MVLKLEYTLESPKPLVINADLEAPASEIWTWEIWNESQEFTFCKFFFFFFFFFTKFWFWAKQPCLEGLRREEKSALKPTWYFTESYTIVPWTEELGRPQSLGLQNSVTNTFTLDYSSQTKLWKGGSQNHIFGTNSSFSQFSSVQSLSCVQLFATPWIAARQASLSITNSRSSFRLMSHYIRSQIQKSELNREDEVKKKNKKLSTMHALCMQTCTCTHTHTNIYIYIYIYLGIRDYFTRKM